MLGGTAAAQRRGGTGRPGRSRLRQPVGDAGPAHAGLRAFDVGAHFAEVVHAGNGRPGADRGDRNTERARQLHDLVDGVLLGPCVHGVLDVVAPGPATQLLGQSRVVGQVRPLDHHREVLPLLRAEHGHPDPAVQRRFDRRDFHRATEDVAHEVITITGQRGVQRFERVERNRTGTRGRRHRRGRPARWHRARRQAARPPMAAQVPVIQSPSWPPAATGGRSGVPRPPMEPDAACSVNSVAGRWAHGPVWPKGVMETMVSAGLAAWSSCGPRPHGRQGPGLGRLDQ